MYMLDNGNWLVYYIGRSERKWSQMKYYTREEVADILGVTARTVYNYVRDGKLKGYRISNRWLFKEEDIDTFVTRVSSFDNLDKED